MALLSSKNSVCLYEDESMSDLSSPENDKAIPFLRYVFSLKYIVVRKRVRNENAIDGACRCTSERTATTGRVLK